ncbi:hypothetical protein [Kitasatospora sp. NPDC001547]|uniref:hypothetical protein n=1 Tax=Kitasatospora sp. NPDC001547 TaxID=3364015 RepID=UPI0036AA91C9
MQVRTPAAAGVPRAEIGPLLGADGGRFAGSLTDVERRLSERIAELTARRDTLHRLADGDRALLPDRACAVLERMPGPDYVAAQREALVLARALVPEGFDGFLTQLEHRLDDPEFVTLARRSREAEAPGRRTTRGSRSSPPRWPTATSPTRRCWAPPPACAPGPGPPSNTG